MSTLGIKAKDKYAVLKMFIYEYDKERKIVAVPRTSQFKCTIFRQMYMNDNGNICKYLLTCKRQVYSNQNNYYMIDKKRCFRQRFLNSSGYILCI